MSVFDPDTLMPYYHPLRWWKLQQKALVYGDSYEAKKNELIDKGWTFIDPQNEADKRAYLHAHSTFTRHLGGADVTGDWYDLYGCDGYFIGTTAEDPNLVTQVWHWLSLGFDGPIDYDTWHENLTHAITLASEETLFKIGVVSCNCNRVLQILIAQTLECFFDLDNRGRPRIH